MAGASKSINLPQSRNVPEADDVSIFRMLPDNVTDGTYLSIYSSFQDVTVFIGGNEVYSYNGTEGLLYTSVPVTSIIFVPMNSSYSSKTLPYTIAVLFHHAKVSCIWFIWVTRRT